jgi:hypothetical protein
MRRVEEEAALVSGVVPCKFVKCTLSSEFKLS